MIKPLPTSENVFEKVGNGHFRELTHDEELVFYREILDKVKVNIYISQINDVNDLTQSRMIWMNKPCTDMTGYSIEEAYEMGYHFFVAVQPPESVEVAAQSVGFLALKEGDSFHGITKQQGKDKKNYWYQGYCMLLHEKNGKPWHLLTGNVNIQDEIHTQLQLIELQKENHRIKNQLKITMLTKREKEILCLIASGKNDREISEESFTSLSTVHTHRKNIHRKLGKTKAAELAVFASEIGLL